MVSMSGKTQQYLYCVFYTWIFGVNPNPAWVHSCVCRKAHAVKSQFKVHLYLHVAVKMSWEGHFDTSRRFSRFF